MLKYENIKNYHLNSKYDIILNKSNLSYYTNDISIYKDVLLLIPYYEENKYFFHSIFAIENITKKYIINSNSYIEDKYARCDSYENQYQIYARIHMTYEKLCEVSDNLEKNDYNKENIININDTCMLFANAFSAANSGHDLSIILNHLDYYLKNNLDCNIILFEESKKIPRNIEIIKLFIPEEKIIYISTDKIYNFKNIHITYQEYFNIFKHSWYITYQEYFNIFKHQYLIEQIKIKSQALVSNVDDLKNKKIILMKNNFNKSVVVKSNCFECTEFFKKMENKGWTIINPEIIDIYTIITLLCYAKKIIFSYGSISYTHIPFVNDNITKIYAMKVLSYENLYCNKKHTVINCKLDLSYIDEKFINENFEN